MHDNNSTWPWPDLERTQDTQIWLRILETTDVHANILPFDYFSGRDNVRYGLARTATLIHQARREAPNCLLFDNGDFLQGTPLSDITARPENGWTGVHPLIAVMNRLDYDAGTLGNHEFNFGIDTLLTALKGADFPFVCANAATARGRDPTGDTTLLPPTAMLDRTVTDTAGNRHALRIGIIGLVPPQITTWDQFHLAGRIASRDIVETARAHVPRLRQAGADLVIALAHTGIETGPAQPGMENAARALAAVPGIDAILAGHSHEVFPAPPSGPNPGADHAAGTLIGVPTVMAGSRGSHLGVLDLCLRRSGDAWRLAAHRAETRPVAPTPDGPVAPPDPDIASLIRPAHLATLRLTAEPIGESPQPIHSYLAQLRADASVLLVTDAQRAALARHLGDTPHADLPVLSASAPYKTGGRAGPGHYTDIPAGALTLRNAADLYPFPNALCGVRLTGADIADWLERAASCFNRLDPGRPDQTLWNPDFPGHAFDTIQGVSYEIDLSAPARYDHHGEIRNPGAVRIRNLCHAGAPIDPTAEFAVATNNYRAFGGGPYPVTRPDAFVHVSHEPIRDILVSHIRSGGAAARPPETPWTFTALDGATVIVETGPGLLSHPRDIAALGARDAGRTAEGFLRLVLPL